MSDWRQLVLDRVGRDHANLPIVDELTQHLEDRFKERRAAGDSAEVARAAALAELDNHEHLATEIALARRRSEALTRLDTDDRRRASVFSGLWADVRYATRSLRRSPGFAVASILTIALTCGPTTAVLGMANWLFTRPIPGVTQADRLGTVNFGVPRETGYSVSRISYAHADAIVAGSPSVQAMTGWQFTAVSVGLPGGESTIRPAQFVGGNFFDVLGVQPVAGRGFLREEDTSPAGATVTVVTDRLAHALFPDRSAINETVAINGLTFTIVGIVPGDFPGTRIQTPVDLWMTGHTTQRVSHVASERWGYAPDRGPFYQYVVRLAPGGTFERAEEELGIAARALVGSAPGTEKFDTVKPMVHPVVGIEPDLIPLLWSLVRILVATGVLLVALGTANLANLFVFRGIRRGPEAALRLALGASATRLTRLHLIESMLISLCGGATALGLILVTRQLLGSAVETRYGSIDIPVNWQLAAIAFTVSVVVGLVLTLLAAGLTKRRAAADTLAGSGQPGGRVGRRVRVSLAAVQVALSLTLVVGALLFAGSLRHLRAMDTGFDFRGVIRTSFDFGVIGYAPERSRQFLIDVTERLRLEHPAMRVAFSETTPLFGNGTGYPVFAPGLSRDEVFRASVLEVSEDYFEVFGIPLLAGRGFSRAEARTTGTEPAVVVSETLARRLYGTPNVVGRVVTFAAVASAAQHDVQIVGVTKDVHWSGFTVAPPPLLFIPAGNLFPFNNALVVRSGLPSDDVARRVRAVASAIDPAVPISVAEPMEARIDARLSEERLSARVFGALAIIGFVLAAVGLHGLVSQTVVERRREFGVRMAIGATRGRIMRLVLRSTVLIAAVGLPLGAALAYAGARLVESRLYGVTPGEPLVFVLSALAILAVAVLASLIPARAAATANPVDILRTD
jgi:predicted permease